LERILGVGKIDRIPLPEGWDIQGAGRRFFVFPDMTMDRSEQKNLFVEANKLFDRSLTLVPDKKRLQEFEQISKEKLGYTIFDVASLEKSKSSFTSAKKALALVANRYEGIDFEGDECRLLFVVNLPKTVNLQETFLFQRMGAMVVLLDRIRTRIIQAIGRCTRGASDFSCVIVMGEDITEYFISKNYKKYYHPELQAEIAFGIDQSYNGNLEDILENIEIFTEQGEEWEEVEKDIFKERGQSSQDQIPGSRELLSSVIDEVGFQNCMWEKNYKDAVIHAQNIINQISGVKELNGYRGFWNYLASVACFLSYKEYNLTEYLEKTNKYLSDASHSSRSISWLRKLSISNFSESVSDLNFSPELASNIEKIDEVFEIAGIASTKKFEKDMKEILEGLSENEATKFERAQQSLGKYLGFESFKDDRDGAPDPIWISNNKLCIVFEDNTGKKNDVISISKTRQAKAHKDWVLGNIPNSKLMEIYTVIVTDANHLDKEAFAFSENVFYWKLEDFRKWANGAILTLRNCRSTYISGSAMWREIAMEAFVKAKIDPHSIKEHATKILLNTIPLK
jgi:Helicase C-terminal domain